MGCAHLPVDGWLKKVGVPAFICPPINIVLYKIRQLAGLAVEIADTSVLHQEGKCIARAVIFKQSEENVLSLKTCSLNMNKLVFYEQFVH